MLRTFALSVSVILVFVGLSFQAAAGGKKKPTVQIIELDDVPLVIQPVAPPSIVVVPAPPRAVVVTGGAVAVPVPVAPPVPGYVQVYQPRPAIPAYLTLTNLSGYTAVSVRIWPSGDCCQGPELLSASGDLYMQSGTARSFSLPASPTCLYDFQIDYLEGAAPSLIRQANLCRYMSGPGTSSWTIYPPRCHGCE